jgi:hypothetical protein
MCYALNLWRQPRNYAPKLLDGLSDSKRNRSNYCTHCRSWTLVWGSCGVPEICGQQIVSYCDPYRLLAKMLPENAGGGAAFPLPFWTKSEPPLSFLWVCVPLSHRYVILRGCPRLPPLLTTERVSHPFRFLFHTRSVQTIFRPSVQTIFRASVHRTSESSLPVGIPCRQCIPFSHPYFILT